MILRNNSNSRI